MRYLVNTKPAPTIMDKYTLTSEGRAKFRRIETRIHSDESAKSEDYDILHYLYERGAASVEELEKYTGLSWNEVTNKLSTLMYHDYIEELTE
jgi:DNA-binding transcriptional ArsR family regulator